MKRRNGRTIPFALIAALVLNGTFGRTTRGAVPVRSERGARSLSFSDGSILKATGPAQLSQSGNRVHLQFGDPRDGAGFEVRPKNGIPSWDLSEGKIVAVEVKNLSPERQQRLVMTLTAPTPEGKNRDITVGIGLNPGETRTLRLPLPHPTPYNGLTGIRIPTLDTAKITRISFAMQWPFEKATPGLMNCELSNLRVEGKRVPPQNTAPSFPFIDRYGQSMGSDWPGKIYSDAELRAQFEREGAELARSARPASWDRFGGWKNGPQLKATGSFRTEKYANKWWMVDPDGRLFISQALDVLSANGEGLKVSPNNASWFEELPAGANSYNAAAHNLAAKYGRADYQAAYYARLVKRLESWGINSIGNWSSPDLMALGQTPYTLQLTDYDARMPRIQGSKGKFYDVFDLAYIEKMRTLVQTAAMKNPMVTKSLTDPMCIGYFIDNELDFGNRGKLTLVDNILRSPATQASKREFASDMQKKYGGVARLNAAWHTNYDNWEALLTSQTIVPETDGYKADASVFFQRVVEQYFRLAHDAVKSAAPHRLYLGARFISADAVRPAFFDVCRRYCDILSVNIYAHSADGFPRDGFPDMPVLVTEFQFGLLQRGMFNPSLCQAGVIPEDRGRAYVRFLQGALVHPNIVGAQYFQYRDQPLTGRGGDGGENYQIGFVDMTDTPYAEMTQASRAVGEGMYTYRKNGKLTNSMSGTH